MQSIDLNRRIKNKLKQGETVTGFMTDADGKPFTVPIGEVEFGRRHPIRNCKNCDYCVKPVNGKPYECSPPMGGGRIFRTELTVEMPHMRTCWRGSGKAWQEHDTDPDTATREGITAYLVQMDKWLRQKMLSDAINSSESSSKLV